MWSNGLIGRSMAAYYAGSGDNRILKTLENGLWRQPAIGSAWDGR